MQMAGENGRGDADGDGISAHLVSTTMIRPQILALVLSAVEQTSRQSERVY